MADIIRLPNAAAEPVINVRRRGAYPKKIKPLWRQRLVRARREDEAAAAANALRQEMEHGRMLIEPRADVRWECSASGLYRHDPQRAIEDLRAIANHIEAKYGLDPRPRCTVLSLISASAPVKKDYARHLIGEKS